MVFLLLTTLALTAGPEVQLSTLAGEQVAGTLAGLTSDGATIATASGERKFAATELLAVHPAAAPSKEASPASVWIELIDGTTLLGTQYQVAKGVASVTLVSGERVDIPTRSLQSVQLQSHDTEQAKASQLARQWQEISTAKHSGDVLVVRKLRGGDDETMQAASLDLLEGVLGDVTNEKVHFTFEDQTIPVDRAKVEGVLYFHPTGRELPSPVCRVADAAGSTWNVKSLTLSDATLQLVSTSGVKFDLPLARLKALDYSLGKIVFLSDLEPETAEWSNAFGPSAALASLTKLFAPRRNTSFDGQPLVIAGQSYDKGLAIHSRTLLEYRLQGKFNKFFALAAIDDAVRPAGNVRLVISLDGKPLGEHTITGKDAAATNLQYDIREGRKLSILVDFGDGLDVADRLHLVNARVTK